MKTKIIYISGDDKFNVSDVRAAFNEIRAALNLNDDTILFGVPVDTDDALNNEFQDVQPLNYDSNIIDAAEPDHVPEEIIEEHIKPEVKKRGRKKAIVPEEQEAKPITEDSPEKIIPILSVLGNNESSSENTGATEQTEPVSESNIVIEHTVTEDDGIVTEADTITVQEIITDNSEPTEINETEKTLEELLESMKPLDSEIEDTASENTDLKEENTEGLVADVTDTDMEDITLQQLATEFIENQDKIVNTTKANSKSKIGKLKNILPFKKQKHEDNSLMGDLFGWAGVAANDEDFSMPGFFTGTTKK